MRKIISMLILTFILLGSVAFATDDYTPRVPKLLFTNIQSIPEVNAGEYLKLKLTLKNDSNNAAKKITITPEIGELPITWEKTTDYYTLKSLSRNAEIAVNYDFKINSSAKLGTYGIKFNFNFYNSREEVFTSSQTIYFKVVKEQSSPILTIGTLKTTPEIVVAGEKVTIDFEIKNIGELPAKSLSVTLNNLSKNNFMPAGYSDTKYIESIEGNSYSNVIFDLNVSKNIPKGTNELEVLINYLDQDGKENSITKKIYITDIISSVEASNSDSGKPKVMITSYSTNPSNIVAGDLIAFSFSFTNTNSSKAIHNMKITISSENGSYNVAHGSNTFYIESLGPNSSMQKSIDLNVKQDLTSGSYPINITFDYEDNEGNTYSPTETINLPVTEYSRLVINSVNCMGGMINNTTSLSFDYINMGKAKISNLTASVEGDFTSNQSINYIGNLEAGNSDYYDIEITPTKSGDANGVLVLSFEDSSGRKINEKKEFTSYIMEEQIYDDPGDDIIAPVIIEEQDVNIWKVIGYGIASLVVSFILTKIIATRIIRKKLEDEI